MKSVASLFVFLMSANSYATVCDDEMRPVGALFVTIKNALNTRDVTPEIIERDVLNGSLKNPFKADPRSVGNISYRKAFTRYSRGLSEEQIQALRAQVREHLRQIEVIQAQVKAGKIEAKPIVAIGLEDTLDLRRDNNFEWTQGTFQGRPVFVGRVRDQDDDPQIVMVDHFRQDQPEKRIVPIGTKEQARQMSRGGTIFQWQGRDYYTRNHDFFTYDLETGDLVTHDNEFWPDPYARPANSKNPETKDALIYPYKDGVHFIASWVVHQGKEHNGLVVWNPTRPERGYSHLLQGDPKILMTVSSRRLKDRFILPFVLAEDPRTVHFFNVADEITHLGSIKTPHADERGATQALTYLVDGKPFALVRYLGNFSHPIGVFDLTQSEFVTELKTWQNFRNFIQMVYVESEGHPYVLLHFTKTWILFDLKTLKQKWEIKPSINFKTSLFRWRSRDYLLRSSENALEIFDMENGHLIYSHAVPGGEIKDVMTFEHNGIPMAFVLRGDRQQPFFVRLMRDDL